MRNEKIKVKALTVALIAAGVAALTGCDNSAKQAAGNNMPPPLVEVAKPIKKKLALWDKYTARINSEYSVDVKARVGGYLQSVNFKDGAYVKKGDLLFVIDPRPYEAALAAAQAQVKEAEAKSALAASNARRAQELFDSKAISKENLEIRQSEVLTTQAALLSAKANLRDAELNLEFTSVTAPISGHVSERYVDAGNLISAGQAQTLASIVSREKVYAYFEVSERDVIKFQDGPIKDFLTGVSKIGPEVELVLTDGGKVYKGRVTYVDNRIDKDSATLTMRAEIDNADGRLMPGMFGELKLQSAEDREYLILPESVVNTDLVSRYVVIVGADNIAKYAPVEVGALIDSNKRIIKSGITADDNVLIHGMSRALPGAKVSPKLIEIEQ